MIINEAWFPVSVSQYFSLASVLAVTSFAVPFIVRGKYRRTILAIWKLIIGAGVLLLAAGVVAVFDRQPFHVTAPLLITGMMMAAAYSFSLFFIHRVYRTAEQRKVAAREL